MEFKTSLSDALLREKNISVGKDLKKYFWTNEGLSITTVFNHRISRIKHLKKCVWLDLVCFLSSVPQSVSYFHHDFDPRK